MLKFFIGPIGSCILEPVCWRLLVEDQGTEAVPDALVPLACVGLSSFKGHGSLAPGKFHLFGSPNYLVRAPKHSSTIKHCRAVKHRGRDIVAFYSAALGSILGVYLGSDS